ncbi:hypothetical protein SKAU_G00165650 [Synaphobranchus kaupii]|uniref:AT-rich interactive domain-containing protein 4B n=1 Tax=Synaphobranchus kaupii TaxID=118154 RepID=A0A9Q1FJD3_SYNKA|nr:hypothetical protein SKAU_G00165650 [Synaphobranchus kaupii]
MHMLGQSQTLVESSYLRNKQISEENIILVHYGTLMVWLCRTVERPGAVNASAGLVGWTLEPWRSPPFLNVGTDVSAKYRGAFCEAKIKTAKRLVKAKVTFKPGSSTGEVHDEHIRGPLKVGATVEVRNSEGVYQEATINKLTDASLYTVVFDDGDEKTLRRSSLCLKGARHFAESETLDRLPLTNPEHFGTPVIGKKTNRGRRSNPVQEEESSSSSSEEEEGDQQENDKLLGKVVCVEVVAASDKKKSTWYPALVISPDCSEDMAMKKDTILVRSFRDGKFCAVLRKDVREIDGQTAPKPDTALKPALDDALEFLRCGAVPSSWRTEVKDETSSSEEDEDDEEQEPEEDASSGEEEEEVEPFPEERENFLQQLYKFMEDRGTPINKRPVLGYRNLNLFKLYRLVHKLGGFDKIDSGSVWKQVYQDLGIPVLNSAAGYNVKCAYRKYLHGFEEYCTSTGITFQMALPQRPERKNEASGAVAGPPVTPSNVGLPEQRGVREEQRSHTEGEPCDLQPAVCKEEEEEDADPCRLEAAHPNKEEDDESISKHSHNDEDDEGPHAVNVKLEPYEELRDGEKSGDDSSQEREGEEFESYPAGMKVQVRYGRGRNQKTYEATVKESDLEGGEVLYLVHYCGWNVRYDEWIKADKIVRPANKNVPKVKHRKKIKNKTEREKDRFERLMDRDDLPFPKNNRIHRFPPLDDHNDKGTKHPSIEITSILNGLQASESSTEESEREEEEEENDGEGDHEEVEQMGCHGDHRKAGPSDGHRVLEHWEGSRGALGGCRAGPGAGGERALELDGQDCMDPGKRRGPSELQGEGASRKRKAEAPGQRTPKGASRSRPRSSSGGGRTADWLPRGSPKRPEERSAGPRGETSSSSSEDEDEGPAQPSPEAGGRGRSKAKGTPSKKYNGLKEKTKGGRSSVFWEVPEKRPKLALGVDERLASSRGKGQKDVWSSIQAQWPKKTLKELFSDSDTEAANSPPPAMSQAEDLQVGDPERDGEAGEGTPEPEKTREPPSSGSNSVLNTPPTTPESPPPLAGSPSRTRSSTPTPAPPPPSLGPAPEASPNASGPQLEESMGGRSETDSSTVEVESLGGELVPEDRAGSPSMAFDCSLSCNSNCSLALSGSSQHDSEQRAKGAALANQKQQKDSQGGGASKKHKRSHKNSGTHPKKRRKIAHSSDSEDHSTSENTAKSPASKTNVVMPKCPSRTPPAGHKYHKQGDSENQGRTPRIYKWSFQMADLEKMTSLERISFLQEKLQDIRNHYLSLKSEVASIDRRRKRLKKKERESTVAASTSSSSSSSPSSSSLTAAVMLTLAEPTVSGSSQNSGVSVECR